MSFSGNKWLDYQILNKLSDLELIKTFRNNENLRVYERDDDFWGDRLATKCPYLVKPKDLTNKEFYQSLIPVMIILNDETIFLIVPPIKITPDYLDALKEEFELIEPRNMEGSGVYLVVEEGHRFNGISEYVEYELADYEMAEYGEVQVPEYGAKEDFEIVRKLIMAKYELFLDEDIFLKEYEDQEFYLGLDKIPPYINGLIKWHQTKKGLLVPI